MRINRQVILDKNDHFNRHVAACQNELSTSLVQAHRHAQRYVHGRTHTDKVANAFVRNAVCGLRLGLHTGVLIGGCTRATQRFPLNVRGAHLPGSVVGSLGPAGVTLLGQLLVGSYHPTPQHRPDEAAATRRFKDRGIIGALAIDELSRAATRAAAKGYHRGSQACLWGAATLELTCTAVRVATFAIQTSLCVAAGVVFALGFGTAAAVHQACLSPQQSIFDIDLATRHLWPRAHNDA